MAQKKPKAELKTKRSYKTVTLFFIILIITVNLFSAVWSSKDKYFNFNYWNNFKFLKNIYQNSQYVSKHPAYIIPDETINSYAAGEYIKGTSPVLVAADTPPLGRYLIGLSTVIFNNENIITIIFSVSSLLLMYLVGFQIFKKTSLALLPPLLFSFEPIFKNQIIYSPLLDIMQLFFLLGCFYFFNKGINSKKFTVLFIFANLFLGLFISTKFFITGVTILASWYLVLFLRKELDRIKSITVSLPISVFVLLLSYAKLFAFGYSIRSFLGVQKYVFLYHKSQLILPFSIWPLLLFNKWFVWFGDKPIISDPQWLITWPIITFTSLIYSILYILKRLPNNKNIEVLMVWVILYLLFFSFGQISSRYFVILIPILYIISIYGLVSIYKIYKK